MIKKIALVAGVALGGLVVGVLGLASTKPDTFEVQRSASIKAAPETVFALVNDFHQWEKWSPFEQLDPAMKKTFSGAESGKGAIYEWSGNDKAGQGRMEILETTPPSSLKIKLDFIKPFEAGNTIDFTMKPEGELTTVTWAMHGPQPLMSKVMCVFMDMDQMIGKDFEKGLASLKTLSEK